MDFLSAAWAEAGTAVDVAELEFHLAFRIILHLPGVLEESDAGTEKHNPLQGEARAARLIGPDGMAPSNTD
jgi:hypothetical protein